jgi:hypothetical protein
MKTLFAAVAIVLLLIPLAHARRCTGGSTRTSDNTRGGGNELITLIERRPLSVVNGVVADQFGAEPEVTGLVEVYTNPGWILKNQLRPVPPQKRIIACEVNSRGRFFITGLKRGVYELRFSAVGPVDIAHMYVTIDPKKGRKKFLRINLQTAM